MTRYTRTLSLFTTSILVGATGSALAESPTALRSGAMPAVESGLEIVVGASAASSTGDIGVGMNAEDVVGSPGQVELQIGYRLTPQFTLGFYSTAHGLSESPAGASSDVYGATAGLEIDMHARPDAAIDPWISVGSGLRALWIQDDRDSVLIGLEVARLQLGVDFRVNEDVAIGPVLGASASFYGAHKSPTMDFHEIDDKGVNWMFSAGVAGRFNAFGTRR